MPKLLPFEVVIGRNANFQILGEKRGKCENSSSRPPKGTFLRENASFDVQIVKIGQPWRPVGEVKKRKKKEKRKCRPSDKQWLAYFTHAPTYPTQPDQSRTFKYTALSPIAPTFGSYVGSPRVLQVSWRSVQRFCSQGSPKIPLFLYLAHWLIQQVWAIAQPVISRN